MGSEMCIRDRLSSKRWNEKKSSWPASPNRFVSGSLDGDSGKIEDLERDIEGIPSRLFMFTEVMSESTVLPLSLRRRFTERFSGDP